MAGEVWLPVVGALGGEVGTDVPPGAGVLTLDGCVVVPPAAVVVVAGAALPAGIPLFRAANHTFARPWPCA